MAFLAWDESYTVGVESIDKQHGILIGILNELHDAMLKGKARSVIGPLLIRLVQYTHEHFAAEEALLKRSDYPDLEQHLEKHHRLIEKVDAFVAQHESGEISINIPLMNFLRDWLNDHIRNTDKEYGPWLNQHGVE